MYQYLPHRNKYQVPWYMILVYTWYVRSCRRRHCETISARDCNHFLPWMSRVYDTPGVLGRGLTTSLVNDEGLTRWDHLVKCWKSRVNITNHDQSVGEGLYRHLAKEIL